MKIELQILKIKQQHLYKHWLNINIHANEVLIQMIDSIMYFSLYEKVEIKFIQSKIVNYE